MLKEIKKLIPLFASYQAIKLVYFFGSRATGEAGPMSDYDFAIYADNFTTKKMFDLKIELGGKLSLALKTDQVDVVVLNLAKNSELKYNIIKEGILIFEREPYRLIMEPKILNEYFDFHTMLVRHKLTKA